MDANTLPTTATPTAPPVCRVVSLTAEPTPAFASGSEPMIESVAGAIVSASPHAVITNRHTRSPYDDDASSPEVNNKPVAVRVSPVATTALLPTRSTNLGLSGATIIIGIANASSRTPVSSAEYPSTNWRYCVSTNNDPSIEKNVSVIAALAAVNRGFLKNDRSSIG